MHELATKHNGYVDTVIQGACSGLLACLPCFHLLAWFLPRLSDESRPFAWRTCSPLLLLRFALLLLPRRGCDRGQSASSITLSPADSLIPVSCPHCVCSAEAVGARRGEHGRAAAARVQAAVEGGGEHIARATFPFVACYAFPHPSCSLPGVVPPASPAFLPRAGNHASRLVLATLSIHSSRLSWMRRVRTGAVSGRAARVHVLQNQGLRFVSCSCAWYPPS